MKTLGISLLSLGLLLAMVPATAQDGGQTAFTIEGVTEGSQNYFRYNGEKNPTIQVAPGEQITVTLKNVGNGVHNIHVDGQPASEYVQADGETIEYTFTAPSTGSVAYWCDPHKGQGMAGTFTTSADTGNNGGNGGSDGGNDTPGVQVVGVALALLGAALVFGRRRD